MSDLLDLAGQPAAPLLGRTAREAAQAETEFAGWMYDRGLRAEIPQVLTWLECATSRGLANALRRMLSEGRK